MSGINVLSLFDGISCGQVAFEKTGIKVKKYYASEVNEDSIKVSTYRYPSTTHLGDVTKLIVLNEDGEVIGVSDTLKSLPKIDFLIGGSPCQGISRAKSIRENLEDHRSKLFYHYVKIKEWLQENNNPNLLFILENVKPNQETEDIMTSAIGVEPLDINSSLFSAQDRRRLYWTNIDVDTDDIVDKGLLIRDILDDNDDSKNYSLRDNEEYFKTVKFGKNVVSWDTSGKGYYSQMNRARYLDKKMNTLPKSNGGDKTRIYLGDYKYRNASVLELERLQTLPDGYTDCGISDSSRRGLIGDGWTVDVIVHILKHAR